MGKFSKMLLNGGKLAGSMQMDRRFMIMKKKCPQGVVYTVYINHDLEMTLIYLLQGQHRLSMHLNGAIYMYMTIIFKHLLLKCLAN